jgi:hypothetical protein
VCLEKQVNKFANDLAKRLFSLGSGLEVAVFCKRGIKYNLQKGGGREGKKGGSGNLRPRFYPR